MADETGFVKFRGPYHSIVYKIVRFFCFVELVSKPKQLSNDL